MEKRSDYFRIDEQPDVIAALDITIIRLENRAMSWQEQHIGFLNCDSLFTCVDYGRYKTQPDNNIIESIINSNPTVKQITNEEWELQPILVLTGDQGYSVFKITEEQKQDIIEKYNKYKERNEK